MESEGCRRLTVRTAYFTSATFRFLRELAENNRKAWFDRNKGRYEEFVKEPALAITTRRPR